MDGLVSPATRLAEADAVFALVEQFAASYWPDRAAFDRQHALLLAADKPSCRISAGGLLGYRPPAGD